MSATLLSDRRRLVTLAAVAAVFLGAIATFNLLQDPYGRFGQTPAIVSIKGTSANIPLSCFIGLRALPARAWEEADVALTGDSRTRQFTVGRAEDVDGHHVINLALGGATLDESLTMLAMEAGRLPHLHTVIVGTPLERFAEAAQPDRCREAEPLARDPLRYLLNWQISEDSWLLFLRTRELGHRPPRPTGMVATVGNGEGDAVFLGGWRTMYAAFDPSRAHERLALLQRTLAPLRARGVEVILWAPSLRPDTRALIGEAGLLAPWQGISAELQREGRFFDFTFSDFLGSIPYTYHDPVHSLQAKKILETLLGPH